MKKNGLVWLHNDLRIHDNATLVNAAKCCDQLIILYATYDFPANHGQSYHFNGLGKHRRRFLHETLVDLSASLTALGNSLLFLDNVSIKRLIELILAYDISDIFYSHSADYNHNLRIELAKTLLPKVNMHETSTATLFSDMPMLNLPKVFTQFRQRVEKDRNLLRRSAPIAHTPTPTCLPPVPNGIDQSLVYTGVSRLPKTGHLIGGENQALLHTDDYFSSEAPKTYKETRNKLDDWYSSTKFSAWLANGALSVRTLLSYLRNYEQNVAQNDSTYWIWFELLWREFFYWYALEHGSKLFKLKGLTPCKRMSCFYGERFERWKNGNTPFPIVNACMNQLSQTGYISNRGRQLVASAFIHELGMDWRYGATYFEQQLIDYDVASNWGNWQYIAGVGADPRGGRRFNLQKQTAQYDPDKTFITQWKGDVGETVIDSVDASDWPIS